MGTAGEDQAAFLSGYVIGGAGSGGLELSWVRGDAAGKGEMGTDEMTRQAPEVGPAEGGEHRGNLGSRAALSTSSAGATTAHLRPQLLQPRRAQRGPAALSALPSPTPPTDGSSSDRSRSLRARAARTENSPISRTWTYGRGTPYRCRVSAADSARTTGRLSTRPSRRSGV